MIRDLPEFRHDSGYLESLVRAGGETAHALRELKELTQGQSQDLLSLLHIFGLSRNFTKLPVEV